MSEANRDEALKCLRLSKQHWSSQHKGLAYKYAMKSVSLFETADGRAWLEKIKLEAGESFESESTKDKPRQETSTPVLEKQTTGSENKEAFSTEQVAEVKRFNKINKNDYYAVLGIYKSSSDADIKKAYRKLALQFHPDKNRAPGADEAFKTISRAFSVLGDASKRQQYDCFGIDPSNPGGSRGSPFSGGFPPGFDAGEINPEDIFRAFFGGGGSPFGSSSFHFQSFGGGNPFFAQQQQQRRRRPQPQPAENRGPASDFDRITQVVRQLLPILLLFFFSILSAWFSGSSSDEMPTFASYEDIGDRVSLEPGLGYPHARSTYKLHLTYYATTPFQAHFKDYDLALERGKRPSGRLQRELFKYEGTIEKHVVKGLQRRCKAETAEINSRMKAAVNGKAELNRLKKQSKPSCDMLHALGIQ